MYNLQISNTCQSSEGYITEEAYIYTQPAATRITTQKNYTEAISHAKIKIFGLVE